MKSGKFITFEGGEGAGKSTQIPYLKSYLESQGLEVIITREPGGSEGAEQIRKLIVHGCPTRWDALTEYLLLSAARRDHIEKLIKPALNQGKWVICDRFFDSSLAYQGAGGGLPESQLQQIYHVLAPDFEPDITFIFDLPLEIAFKRVQRRAGHEERFEQMSLDFHRRVRNEFLKICKNHPQRCFLIDADQPIEDIAKDIQNHLIKIST
ncbi:MAG: dTMP kinase [Janthinobacterium lividum]